MNTNRKPLTEAAAVEGATIFLGNGTLAYKVVRVGPRGVSAVKMNKSGHQFCYPIGRWTVNA